MGDKKMKFRIVFAILAALGLLASCAHIDPHPMDMSRAEKSAKTSRDHLALANHYDQAAQSLQAKAEAEKQHRNEYLEHAPYYGRQTEDLKEHSEALIRVYEEAAEKNRRMAEAHRRMAEQAKS
jgi:biopolymer transport protein ExbB/TolQ